MPKKRNIRIQHMTKNQYLSYCNIPKLIPSNNPKPELSSYHHSILITLNPLRLDYNSKIKTITDQNQKSNLKSSQKNEIIYENKEKVNSFFESNEEISNIILPKSLKKNSSNNENELQLQFKPVDLFQNKSKISNIPSTNQTNNNQNISEHLQNETSSIESPKQNVIKSEISSPNKRLSKSSHFSPIHYKERKSFINDIKNKSLQFQSNLESPIHFKQSLSPNDSRKNSEKINVGPLRTSGERENNEFELKEEIIELKELIQNEKDRNEEIEFGIQELNDEINGLNNKLKENEIEKEKIKDNAEQEILQLEGHIEELNNKVENYEIINMVFKENFEKIKEFQDIIEENLKLKKNNDEIINEIDKINSDLLEIKIKEKEIELIDKNKQEINEIDFDLQSIENLFLETKEIEINQNTIINNHIYQRNNIMKNYFELNLKQIYQKIKNFKKKETKLDKKQDLFVKNLKAVNNFMFKTKNAINEIQYSNKIEEFTPQNNFESKDNTYSNKKSHLIQIIENLFMKKVRSLNICLEGELILKNRNLNIFCTP